MDSAPVDGTVSTDHTVTRYAMLVHSMVRDSVGDQCVDLHEATFIEQGLDSVSCGPTATGPKHFHPLGSSPGSRDPFPIPEILERVVEFRTDHGGPSNIRFLRSMVWIRGGDGAHR